MKYYIIAGEASGDLHASNLVASLRALDSEAQFKGMGGDLMQQQGVNMVRHYRDMAYMGFIQVILHLRTILGIMREACRSIDTFHPDMVILVDYPSFNLKIAKYVHQHHPDIPVYYYIAPKLWAWKAWRLKAIKKNVDRVFSILPFEVEWFGSRGCQVDYIGNPCVDAVEGRNHKGETFESFSQRNGLTSSLPIIALLAGSRVQEIRQNLPAMLQAASTYPQFQLVIAGAPSIEASLYDEITAGYNVKVVYGETYELLQQAYAAVVTSGTATLETALMQVPQVVVYYVSGGKPAYYILRSLIHVKYVSLVNLIAGREVVHELLSYEFTADNIRKYLAPLLQDGDRRSQMLADYRQIIEQLGTEPVSQRAAKDLLDTYRQRPQ
jgi:lipid-A-disaccharide synthase